MEVREWQRPDVVMDDYIKKHHDLGPGYSCPDLDGVEWRAGRGIVAFIDRTAHLKNVKHLWNSMPMINERIQVLQIPILKQLHQMTKIPAYFTIHTDDLSFFHVLNVGTNEKKVMNSDQYWEFIKRL